MKEAAEKAVVSERRMKPQWIACVAARLALCGVDCSHLFSSLAALRPKSSLADTNVWPEEQRALIAMDERSFGRFSELPLLHLLRYNRRVPKIARPPEDDCGVPEVSELWGGRRLSGEPEVQFFEDPHLPLVVDLGCGRGMWLLQLFCKLGPAYKADWNGLGIDTSPRLLAYPDGVVTRDKLKHRLRFAVGHAEEIARRLSSYPGNVIVVGLNFPTPFALRSGRSEGNSQLPSEEDFMVSPSLLQNLERLSGTTLFFQSDTEDVALRMREQLERNRAFEVVMELDPFNHSGTNRTSIDTEQVKKFATLRQERVFKSSEPQLVRRAFGRGWLDYSPFPPSEHEARCMADEKQVYRFAASVS